MKTFLWVQPFHRLNFKFRPAWEEIRYVFFEAPDNTTDDPRERWEEAWQAAYIQIADWFMKPSGKIEFWSLSIEDQKRLSREFWESPQAERIKRGATHPHLSWSSVMTKGYPKKVEDLERVSYDD